MTFPKLFTVAVAGLFGVIAVAAVVKGRRHVSDATEPASQEIVLSSEILSTNPVLQAAEPVEAQQERGPSREAVLPTADEMDQFFNVGEPKLPIVETVVYTRKVPWLQGKAAWVVDYAKHYDTSRHFIARSLNCCRNYNDQRVANGDRFNVFKKDRPLSFHLVVDTSRCRMWVYYHDEQTDQRRLVKTYEVGIGRDDPKRASGSLTPHGVYSLGENIAIYREGVKGQHNGEMIEMRQVFGTRWIPFNAELAGCTAPAKGLGLHGCPWTPQEGEDATGLGEHSSDGCIRLATDDMEELFAVVITKPTTIYLVPDFFDAKLPGKEF